VWIGIAVVDVAVAVVAAFGEATIRSSGVMSSWRYGRVVVERVVRRALAVPRRRSRRRCEKQGDHEESRAAIAWAPARWCPSSRP
jgi:hypothetical protein